MGYITATIQIKGHQRPVLLEITPTTWERFKIQSEAEDIEIEAGLLIEAFRAKSRTPLVLSACELTDRLNSSMRDRGYIIDCVARIHGIQGRAEGETVPQWAQRTQLARQILVAKMLDK